MMIPDSPSLMRCADTLRRMETGPMRQAWWAGYIRGLRRANHGESFGTEAEHRLYLSLADDAASDRAAIGRGYRAGLEGIEGEP
ncbi:MAG: hypothetical protein LBS40_00140 [Burkholderiales bacterium]|nr:hypothetical protein [Burkholderiales bacterium]